MKMGLRFIVWILILSSLVSFSWAQSGRHRPKPKPGENNSSTNSSTTTANPTENKDGNTDSNGSSSGSTTSTPSTGSAGNSDASKPVIQRADPNEIPDDAPALKIDATLVTVPVVVSDRTGRYVPFLKDEDFKLFEDGVKQDISFFTSERKPFKMGIVMDTSGSISSSMSTIQESAVRFTRELKEDDEIMVVEFNSKVEVLNELTSDRYKIRHSIETTRAGGGTRLYDALYVTAKKMKDEDGRKAIILITDGEDTESRDASERQALDAVLESGALMYVIQFPADEISNYGGGNISMGSPSTFPGSGGGRSSPGRYPDTPFLHDIVKYTGGDTYYAGGRNGLPNVWKKIADDLRHVYVLGYYPTNAIENGGKRQVKVQLKDTGVGAIRYRPGYSTGKNKPNEKDKQTAKS